MERRRIEVLWTRIPFPPLAVFCYVTFILAFIQTLMLNYQPEYTNSPLLGVPVSIGGLAFDVTAFFAGCAAYKNDWLSTDLGKWKLKGTAGMFLGISLVFTVGLVLVGLYMARADEYTFRNCQEGAFPPDSALNKQNFGSGFGTCSSRSGMAGGGKRTKLMPIFVFVSCATPFLVVANIWLFQRLNPLFKLSIFRKFLSPAAYGVYLLHPLVWPVVSWYWYQWVYLGQMRGEKLRFWWCFDMPISYDTVGGGQPNKDAPMTGFLTVLAITQAIIWPTCWFLKSYVPGFRTLL